MQTQTANNWNEVIAFYGKKANKDVPLLLRKDGLEDKQVTNLKDAEGYFSQVPPLKEELQAQPLEKPEGAENTGLPAEENKALEKPADETQESGAAEVETEEEEEYEEVGADEALVALSGGAAAKFKCTEVLNSTEQIANQGGKVVVRLSAVDSEGKNTPANFTPAGEVNISIPADIETAQLFKAGNYYGVAFFDYDLVK